MKSSFNNYWPLCSQVPYYLVSFIKINTFRYTVDRRMRSEFPQLYTLSREGSAYLLLRTDSITC